MQSTSKLIVNADDLGLTPGVNRAVRELGASGALTSATLMANGAAFDDAVQTLGGNKWPAVGCHVVLVDGSPTSGASQVSSLVQEDGRLRDSLPGFLIDLQLGRIRESEIEEEAVAQIRRLQSAGIAVSHVDTHKHTHLFPKVARPLMRAASRCGITAIRNPFEPAWSASYTRGALVRKLEVTLLRGFAQTFHSLCRDFGLFTTDGCIGVSATGRLDAATLTSLLRQLPGGTYELVCHPGYQDEALSQIRTRLRESREIEREILHEQIPEAAARGHVQLLSFAGLAAQSTSGS